MSEQHENEATHLFATIGASTGRGRRVSRITTKAGYEGKVLARVGDIVTCEGGSHA